MDVFKSQIGRMTNEIKGNVFKPEKLPHEIAPQKMEPVLKDAIESGDATRANFVALSESSIIRGGLIGAILTAIIGFNAGKYSRFGAARKKFAFVRRFIERNKKPLLIPYTDYFYPNLRTVTKNFMCFSGETGIGKSYHFQNIAYLQSLVRPSLYLSFKSTGQGPTFQQDLTTRLQYGSGDNPLMLSQIIQAVRYIDKINTNPQQFWYKVAATHGAFLWCGMQIIDSHMLESSQSLFVGMLATSYLYYFYMLYPFIMQSFRRTKPLIIFDDLSKVANINKLAEISRYLQLLEKNMANVILVSSDEEVWFRLRKQPGMKDRLRQRILTYNSKKVADQVLKFISVDKNYQEFIKKKRMSPLYTKQLVVLLIKQLIANRQCTMRRLGSILILNDQQQYQKFVAVLVAYRQNKISAQQAVNNITQILYDSQKETLCAKLKHIKRMVNISEQDFIAQMRLLLEKGRLPSDNKIAPLLMTYSIVRDSKSEYVFNGKFMYTVFRLAHEQYIKDLKQFHAQKISDTEQKFDAEVGSRDLQGKKAADGRAVQEAENIREILRKAQKYEK